VLIVVIGLGVLVRRTSPALPQGTTSHPPGSVSPPAIAVNPSPATWRKLVDASVASGRIAAPAILATLRMPVDVTRGNEPRHDSVTAPAGVVVEESRPKFRWDGQPGAVYTVSVLDVDREVARSAPLRSETWTPEHDLERGRTYRWQVKASRGKDMWIIPPAPQPAPVFAVLDDAAHRDLDFARRTYPGDHLLLGVLAAHYGLQKEAIEELTRNHSDHPDSRSPALLESVRAWAKGDGR
jgi:hypothetical protein